MGPKTTPKKTTTKKSSHGKKLAERGQVAKTDLKDLLLDQQNPRFGEQESSSSQQEILDHIVEKFGVDDVLSSLAVNGYFEAEPLVCLREAKTGNLIVKEGNRRLAACWILTDDPRAKHQATRGSKFRRIWEEHEKPAIDPVPTIIFDDTKADKTALLSYLGVRHIVSSQPWDSFAKAAWAANVMETSNLDIRTVAEMIGDRHQTVSRMLEGYYFVQQLIEAEKFYPENSQRKGRGSVTAYPFSWIYTILGYASARNFLNLESEAEPKPAPLLDERSLDRGRLVLQAMFGDRSMGRSSSLTDSRELSTLASALADPVKVRHLEHGKSIQEIRVITQPLDSRLAEGLGVVKDTLSNLIVRLSEEELEKGGAVELSPMSSSVKKLATNVDERIQKMAQTGNEK